MRANVSCARSLPLIAACVCLIAGVGAGSLRSQTACRSPAQLLTQQPFVTDQAATLRGSPLSYRAELGALLLNKEASRHAFSMSYFYYSRTGENRPLVVLFNGGPASATIWLHLAAFGPVRVTDDVNGHAALADNPNSLLPIADLLFVDAPRTGFSAAPACTQDSNVDSVDTDLQAFALFIKRFIATHEQQTRPLYLVGESYGGTRATMLAPLLQKDGVHLAGLILLSPVIDYNIFSRGEDRAYALALPTMAAVAAYQKSARNQTKHALAAFNTATHFVEQSYWPALAKGSSLPPESARRTAGQLNQMTGISASFFAGDRLRLSTTRFRELFPGPGRILGRYDGRVNAPYRGPATKVPRYDPSSTSINSLLESGLKIYLRERLHYTGDATYLLSSGAISGWDWTHADHNFDLFGGQRQPMVYAGDDMADALHENEALRVFVASSLFDLATPATATTYDLDHLPISKTDQERIIRKTYLAGHMIYLDQQAANLLFDDLQTFVGKKSAGAMASGLEPAHAR